MSRVTGFEMKLLQAPIVVTAGGLNSSWIDLLDYVLGPRPVKFVWAVGVGTTAGTASGLIQQASTTAGSDAATLASFSNVTSAGGSQEIHGVPTKRYVRLVSDAQTGKDMIITAFAIGDPRYTP